MSGARLLLLLGAGLIFCNQVMARVRPSGFASLNRPRKPVGLLLHKNKPRPPITPLHKNKHAITPDRVLPVSRKKMDKGSFSIVKCGRRLRRLSAMPKGGSMKQKHLVILAACLVLASGSRLYPENIGKRIDRLMSSLYRNGQFNGTILANRDALKTKGGAPSPL